MELVRIPIKELDKIWGLVEQDIKDALHYSSQLTDQNLFYRLQRMVNFKFGFCGISLNQNQ